MIGQEVRQKASCGGQAGHTLGAVFGTVGTLDAGAVSQAAGQPKHERPGVLRRGADRTGGSLRRTAQRDTPRFGRGEGVSHDMAPMQQVPNLPPLRPRKGGRPCGVGRPGIGTGAPSRVPPHGLAIEAKPCAQHQAHEDMKKPRRARLLRQCYRATKPATAACATAGAQCNGIASVRVKFLLLRTLRNSSIQTLLFRSIGCNAQAHGAGSLQMWSVALGGRALVLRRTLRFRNTPVFRL